MMKPIIFTGVLVLASAMTGEAMALCGAPWTRAPNLISALTGGGAPLGMTACNAADQGIQEEHHSDGELWDFKCGPTGYPATASGTACAKPDTDRRKKVGTWAVTNNTIPSRAAVTYVYTDAASGASFTSGPFRVFTDGAQYDFCSGNNSIAIATLVATTGSSRVCP